MEKTLKTSNYGRLGELGQGLLKFDTNFSLDPELKNKAKEWLDSTPKELDLANIELILESFVNLERVLGKSRSYDVIVATSSLLYPLAVVKSNQVPQVAQSLLSSILQLLSPYQGKLYCDMSAFTQIFPFLEATSEGETEFKFNGMHFSIRQLYPWTVSRTLTPNGDLVPIIHFGSGTANVNTDSIIVVTRTQ